ncbi:MAG: hypothetical protein R2856_03520 [Caldilineaceae bacterium]
MGPLSARAWRLAWLINAAAGGDHQPAALAQLATKLRLCRAKDLLAFRREDLGNGLAEMGFELLVHVHERAVELFGQQATNRRLARPHEAGEGDVGVGVCLGHSRVSVWWVEGFSLAPKSIPACCKGQTRCRR